MSIRKARKSKTPVIPKITKEPIKPPQLQNIKPKTLNQKKIFDHYYAGKHLFLHGSPGTGKSFLSIFLALQSIERGDYDRLVIVRSAVPSRKQGFLPGNEKEKNEVYEIPYISIVDELFDRRNMYKGLKAMEKIDFVSTSYLRGITIDDAVILIDEVQNLTFMELHTIMTRIGQNCKVIISGDEYQNDLFNSHEESCINKLLKTIDRMPSFIKIQMGLDDICRNQLVKEWIKASMYD